MYERAHALRTLRSVQESGHALEALGALEPAVHPEEGVERVEGCPGLVVIPVDRGPLHRRPQVVHLAPQLVARLRHARTEKRGSTRLEQAHVEAGVALERGLGSPRIQGEL